MKLQLSLVALSFATLQVKCAPVAPREAYKILSPPPEACADPRTAVPFYRGYSADLTDHFFTADVDEFNDAVNLYGYADEGVTGWVFPSSQSGTTPLYRLWSSDLGDHFYTTSASDRSDAVLFESYEDQGIAGYLYTADSNCGGVAWWELWSSSLTDHQYTASVAEKDYAVSVGDDLIGIAGYVLPY